MASFLPDQFIQDNPFFGRWGYGNPPDPRNDVDRSILLMGKRQKEMGFPLNDDYVALIPRNKELIKKRKNANDYKPCTVLIISQEMTTNSKTSTTVYGVATLAKIEVIKKIEGSIEILYDDVTEKCKREGRFDTAAIKAVRHEGNIRVWYEVLEFKSKTRMPIDNEDDDDSDRMEIDDDTGIPRNFTKYQTLVERYLNDGERGSDQNDVQITDVTSEEVDFGNESETLKLCAKMDEIVLNQGKPSGLDSYVFYSEEYKYYIEDKKIWRLRARWREGKCISTQQPFMAKDLETDYALGNEILEYYEGLQETFDVTTPDVRDEIEKRAKRQNSHRPHLLCALLYQELMYWRPLPVLQEKNGSWNGVTLQTYIEDLKEKMKTADAPLNYPEPFKSQYDSHTRTLIVVYATGKKDSWFY